MGRFKRTERVDTQVSILIFLIVVVSCSCIFILNYSLTYDAMILDLVNRAEGIHSYLEKRIGEQTIANINTKEDMDTDLYMETKEMLENVRESASVRYLYTAKQSANGEYIYLVDGLPVESSDFRNAGDLLEEEIIPDIRRALDGETVLPDRIKDTSWGYIFISYFPIHEKDRVIGAVGIEFDAANHYNIYRILKLVTPCIILLFCCIASLLAVKMFRRISNPAFRDFANTDRLTGLANRNAFDVAIHNLQGTNKQKRVSFISIDFDGLKVVNDTKGHDAGDAYLKNGTGLIKECVRESDILYRIGGDEFALLLYDRDMYSLEAIVERIQKRMDAYNKTSDMPVSFSMGCARFDQSRDVSALDTLKRADERMYRNKREKKNNVK